MEAWSELAGGYSWEHGQLMPDSPVDAVSALHANLVLAENLSELHKLQETLPGVVADM